MLRLTTRLPVGGGGAAGTELASRLNRATPVNDFRTVSVIRPTVMREVVLIFTGGNSEEVALTIDDENVNSYDSGESSFSTECSVATAVAKPWL